MAEADEHTGRRHDPCRGRAGFGRRGRRGAILSSGHAGDAVTDATTLFSAWEVRCLAVPKGRARKAQRFNKAPGLKLGHSEDEKRCYDCAAFMSRSEVMMTGNSRYQPAAGCLGTPAAERHLTVAVGFSPRIARKTEPHRVVTLESEGVLRT